MEIHRALDQISAIHDHLAKAEVYRGYRSIPAALSGVLALVAAALQPGLVGQAVEESFVIYWITVAVVGSVLAGGGIVYNYFFRENEFARRLTRRVVGQVLPPLFAGVVVTAIVVRVEAVNETVNVALLPGIWACLYSLGVFASRPYLPRMIGWVALFYFLAGGVLMSMSGSGASLSPWGMGLTFGIGQIFAGIVLHWNLERKEVG